MVISIPGVAIFNINVIYVFDWVHFGGVILPALNEA